MLINLSSCYKNDLPIADKNEDDKISVIGKKLENPYSLKNMNKAYINLLRSKGLEKEIPSGNPLCINCTEHPLLLEPTHTYVRILPQDSSHYDELLNDTNVVMFDYPLDVEISEGENTVVAERGTNGFKYLYTKLPVDGYETPALSGIQLLDSLYIPVELDASKNPNAPLDEQGNIITKSGAKINFYDILDESMRLTGHLNNEIKTKGLFGSKWNPSSTIKAWDNQTNSYIPLKRAKVRARHLFHWETKYTNNNGFAKFGTFRYGVNYSIAWEGNGWDIRDGIIWQAYYNGPKLKSHWNLNIRGKKSGHYSMIHRACVRYFHENIGNIKRPYNFLSKDLKIAYLDKNNNRANGYFAPWTTSFPLLQNIALYSTVQGERRTEFEIFSTTIHEIAHYAHSMHMGGAIQFYQVSNNIGESWARAVQWHLGNIEYSNLNHLLTHNKLNNIVSTLAIQDWGSKTQNKAYSPLFIDLVENFNQSIVSADYPNDNVTGFTMAQLNNILKKGYGLASLKAELKKNKPSGVTNIQIDQLFLRYEQLM